MTIWPFSPRATAALRAAWCGDQRARRERELLEWLRDAAAGLSAARRALGETRRALDALGYRSRSRRLDLEAEERDRREVVRARVAEVVAAADSLEALDKEGRR